MASRPTTPLTMGMVPRPATPMVMGMASSPTTPMMMGIPPWTPGDLWSRLNMPHIDEADIKRALNSAADIDYSDRGRAQQMLETWYFRNWMLTRCSTKLLVHEDLEGLTNRTPPLTALTATMVFTLRQPPNYMPWYSSAGITFGMWNTMTVLQ